MSSTIDFNFRPASYWPEQPNQAQRLSRIMGQERRYLAKNMLENGDFIEFKDSVMQEQLAGPQREEWGRIAPAMMGGEYLPPFRLGETEIARIVLESVMEDVISIRARRVDSRIAYTIVDEYQTVFETQREYSKQPLTLREVVDLVVESIDPDNPGFGLLVCHWERSYEEEWDVRKAVAFAQIESSFYPQLARHFCEVAHDWCIGKLRKQRDASREERRRKVSLKVASSAVPL